MHFSTSHLTALATVLSLLTPALGLGINCRGSGACAFSISSDIAKRLTDYIDGIDPNRWYNNGEHIACATFDADEGTVGHICVFLQNTGGAPGQNIRGLAHFIPEHGCRDCGSVPYFFPDDNNVDDGELTYNVVGSDACGDGLC